MLTPIPTHESHPDPEELNEATQEREAAYRQMLLEFTLHGRPGYRFKSVLDKMNKCLTLPKVISEEIGVSKDDEDRESNPDDKPAADEDAEDLKVMQRVFKGGRMFLIPSFYRMILALRKAKREFAIIFHTFEDELPDVIDEFNLFCKGVHPLYNGKHGNPLVRFDGKNRTKDMFIDHSNQGYITRHSPHDTLLVLGTLKRHPKEEDPEEFHQGGIDEGLISIYNDNSSIFVAMHEKMLKVASMALVDDKEYWEASGRTAEAGKLLLID